LLCGRLLTGWGIGLRAALIDVAYAALEVAGATPPSSPPRPLPASLPPSRAAALLAAVGCRSFAWFAVPSGAAAIVGQQGCAFADAVSGPGIMGIGGLLGWRASAASDPAPLAATL
jgi:hypothetical protein